MTALDTLNAVNEMVVGLYGSDKSYMNYLPKGFQRPSFLYEHVRQSRRDATRYTQQITDYITITIFAPLDAHGNSDMTDLLQRQFAVINLFSDCSITVGNRHVHVTASSGGASLGEAYVELTLEYFDDRPNQRADASLIGDVNIKYNY